MLVCQHDGYVLDGNCWDDEFFKYDYIGAPWLYVDGKNVGNGGFSLRSKTLQHALATDSFISATDPEDQAIGRLYRDYLIKKYDIKFPPEELADKFSFELKPPAQPTFGFHGWFHEPYKPVVVIKRTGAMGDVIRLEPVMRYFNDTGNIVVLETSQNFYGLFLYHDYKIYNYNIIDKRFLINAKYYDLDMSYEKNPKVPHLISYFEACGVDKNEYNKYIVKQKLSLGFTINEQTKLFKKYAILNIDDRPQAGRNVRGIDWDKIVYELNNKDYHVIQIGFQDKKIKNAPHMKTINENLLCYVVAGADLFIGVDSGVSHIAVGFNIPSLIFFGNVDPDIIHVDFENIVVMTNHNKNSPICDNPYCWHSVVGCEGVPCYIDVNNPPCSNYETNTIVNFIKLIK